VKLLNPVRQGEPVRWADVAVDGGSGAVRARKEMESKLA
jgi:hypothetical protein